MSNISDPAKNAATVTPSDSTTFAEPTRALYIGSAAGNLTVRMWPGGQTVQFTAVPIGVLPVQVDRVLAATTSTGILRLW